MTDTFKSTPKPRGFNVEEEAVFSGITTFHGGIPEPQFEGTDNVWATGDTGQLPVYRIYATGTNDLRVMRYTWESDKWELIQLIDITNLYSFLWRVLLYVPVGSSQWKPATRADDVSGHEPQKE